MDPISRRYLDQVVDAEDAYQAIDDDRAMVEALHRQVLALASLAAHLAELIAAPGGGLVEEDAAERDDPVKAWTPEDEAAYQTELPSTQPHQP